MKRKGTNLKVRFDGVDVGFCLFVGIRPSVFEQWGKERATYETVVLVKHDAFVANVVEGLKVELSDVYTARRSAFSLVPTETTDVPSTLRCLQRTKTTTVQHNVSTPG